MYEEYLKPVFAISITQHIKIGLALGFNAQMQYLIIGAMFMSAIYIVGNNKDVNAGDAFMALFVIMFGASNAGTAAAMGPDMGKATVAL